MPRSPVQFTPTIVERAVKVTFTVRQPDGSDEDFCWFTSTSDLDKIASATLMWKTLDVAADNLRRAVDRLRTVVRHQSNKEDGPVQSLF